MSNLIAFNFEEFEVRFVDGKPVANDVATALGYADPAATISRKVFAENKSVAKATTVDGKSRDIMVLEEPGIYQLIFSSKLDSSQKFQQWVFGEVLPSIRETGGYHSLPKDYLSALKALVVAEEEKLELSAKNKILEAQTEFYSGKLVEAEDTLQTYRAITHEDSCLSMKQVADALNIKKLGRNNLIKYLQEKEFLIQSAPVPYRKALEAEWAIVVTSSWQDNYGNIRTNQSTKFTFKGLKWLVKTLARDGYDVRMTASQIWDTYNAVSTSEEAVESESALAEQD
jgi:prophage antirepressor-like protein